MLYLEARRGARLGAYRVRALKGRVFRSWAGSQQRLPGITGGVVDSAGDKLDRAPRITHRTT